MIVRPRTRLNIQIFAALIGGGIADPLAPYRARSQSAVMTKHLPHSEQAILDIRKVEGYCLNPSHPRGRHKTRVFREALTFSAATQHGCETFCLKPRAPTSPL